MAAGWTKLIFAFRNFANAPKNSKELFSCYIFVPRNCIDTIEGARAWPFNAHKVALKSRFKTVDVFEELGELLKLR